MFGCLQLPASHLDGADKFVRLWVHESYRVFADRLIEAVDGQMFFDMVEEACKDCFKTPMDKVMGHLVSGKGTGTNQYIDIGQKSDIKILNDLYLMLKANLVLIIFDPFSSVILANPMRLKGYTMK